MNDYFSLFGLPVKFSIDQAGLKKIYFEESRRYHPDFFANAGEEERNLALAKSIIINNAFKTLSNESSRIKYILELKGILSEKEKEALPSEFLMEMMDINEQILESAPADYDSIREHITKIEKSILDDMHRSMEEFDASENPEVLKQIKEAYLKQKYIWRLRESMMAS
jgi:molecular chaperone HscB